MEQRADHYSVERARETNKSMIVLLSEVFLLQETLELS